MLIPRWRGWFLLASLGLFALAFVPLGAVLLVVFVGCFGPYLGIYSPESWLQAWSFLTRPFEIWDLGVEADPYGLGGTISLLFIFICAGLLLAIAYALDDMLSELHRYCEDGNFIQAEKLLKWGVHPNEKRYGGKTALFFTVPEGVGEFIDLKRREIAELL